MGTLIVYATKNGCTEKCAATLAEKLTGEVRTVNLERSPEIELSKYDTVIIGSPIYIGQSNKVVRKFCEENLDALKKKKLGLYICCMFKGDTLKKQIEEAYPDQLKKAAAVTECFGGEMLFSKLNFIQRVMVKKVAGIHEDTSEINESSILSFASVMNGNPV